MLATTRYRTVWWTRCPHVRRSNHLIIFISASACCRFDFLSRFHPVRSGPRPSAGFDGFESSRLCSRCGNSERVSVLLQQPKEPQHVVFTHIPFLFNRLLAWVSFVDNHGNGMKCFRTNVHCWCNLYSRSEPVWGVFYPFTYCNTAVLFRGIS